MFNYIIQFCIYHVHVFKFLSFLFNYSWYLFQFCLFYNFYNFNNYWEGVLGKYDRIDCSLDDGIETYLSCKFLSIRSCLLVFQIIVHVLERNTIFKLYNSLINWIISFMWVWIHFFSEQIEHQLDCLWVLIK